jgi:hypothetical protein
MREAERNGVEWNAMEWNAMQCDETRGMLCDGIEYETNT